MSRGNGGPHPWPPPVLLRAPALPLSLFPRSPGVPQAPSYLLVLVWQFWQCQNSCQEGSWWFHQSRGHTLPACAHQWDPPLGTARG